MYLFNISLYTQTASKLLCIQCLDSAFFYFHSFQKAIYFYVSIYKVKSCGSGVPIDDYIYLVMPGPSQFPDVADVQWENAIYSRPREKLQTPDPNPHA